MAKNTPPIAELAEQKPTAVQTAFADFIERQTGYTPDVTTMVLFQRLRFVFQKSPENQQSLAARKAVAEVRRNAPKPPRKPRAAKAPAAKAAPAKVAAKKAPAKAAPAKRAPAKKAPAKKAPAARGNLAAVQDPFEEE
jgi:hypothetical protein